MQTFREFRKAIDRANEAHFSFLQTMTGLRDDLTSIFENGHNEIDAIYIEKLGSILSCFVNASEDLKEVCSNKYYPVVQKAFSSCWIDSNITPTVEVEKWDGKDVATESLRGPNFHYLVEILYIRNYECNGPLQHVIEEIERGNLDENGWPIHPNYYSEVLSDKDREYIRKNRPMMVADDLLTDLDDLNLDRLDEYLEKEIKLVIQRLKNHERLLVQQLDLANPILPSIKQDPARSGQLNAEDCPVVLRNPGEPIYVMGKQKDPLTGAQHLLMKVLADAWPNRLKLDLLRKACRSDSPHKTLRSLVQKDPDFKAVISFPGPHKNPGGYGLIQPRSF